MRKKILPIFLVCILIVTNGLVLTACAPEKIIETVVVTQVVEKEGEEVVVTRVVEATPVPEGEAWKDWEAIKVGVPARFSGIRAPIGLDTVAAVNLAIEKINEEGGVLGKPVEAVYTDLKESTSEDCTLAADVMHRAGVVANFPGSFPGTACVHAFGKYKEPLWHVSASSDAVAAVVEGMPEYRNIFQMCASEYVYGRNAYDVMVNTPPYEYPNKKVALLGGDITYDIYIQQDFKEAALADGWEVVLDDTYSYGNTEFGAQLATIRAEEPAIIFGCLTSVDSAVAFMNQFLENPTNSMIYIQWSPNSPEFINLLGEKANGVLWSTLIGGLPTPENEAFAKEFEERQARKPGATFPYFMVDNLWMWKEAAESCGSPVDYECIYEWFENLDEHAYAGLCGTYGFDPEGREGRAGSEWLPIQMTQIQDQKNRILYLGTVPQEGEAFIVPPWIE